ncbi:MAG: PAS domain S-box protein, partial [Verrucomicrobiota bacterium]
MNRTLFLTYLFLWLSLVGTAIYDWFSPLGISDCVWYFLPLFLSSHVGGRRFSLHLAGLITVLALVGFYLSPPGVLPQNSLVARLIIVIAVWMIAFLIGQRKVANHTRHGTERALRCTNKCNQIITRAIGEDSLLRDICQTIISEGGYRMAWVGFAEDDAARSIRIGAVAGHDEGYLDAAKITWSATDPRGCGPAGTAIRTGKKVVCHDFLKDPTTVPWRSEAARRGYAAGIVLPLLHLEKSLGVLMLYSSEPNSFGTEEIQLLEHLAENLSFGLVTLRQRGAQARAEAALLQSHNFHLKLLYQAPALIWRSGLDAKCDWFNQTWLAFTGRTLEQELGDGWAEGVFPEDLPACFATYQEAFAARRTFEMEYRLRRHDGQFRWIVDHGIPYHDDAGNFAGYFGYCFDITERRQAQESLNFHGFVLNRVKEGIYLLRVADGTVFYANPGLEQMFGYAPGALSGQPATILYAPAEKSPAVRWAEITERLAAKGTWTGELLSCKQDGSFFWTYVTAASSTHPEQGLVYLFTHVDISARKEMEQNLLASEARLRTYLHQAGDAFFAHDQAGRLLDVNERACTSLGYTREELLQLFVWDFDVDCQPAPVVALWQEMPPGQVVSFLSHHRRKDGSVFPIEVVLRREEFLDQPLFLALVRDISRRVEQENEIRRMNHLYAAANQINQAIVQVSAREPMFAEICRVLVETGGFAMAWVGWLKDAGSQIEVAARHGDERGYLLDLNVLPNQGPAGDGPTGNSMRQGRTIVCKDIATDPLMARWRDKALAHGFAALLAVPIRLQGEIAGALVVYAREKSFFGTPEIALLESSARDISIGLDQLDREAKRRQAESALWQSEARLQGYFNSLSAGVGITSPTAGWIDANPRLQEMLGYSLEELRSLSWIELTHPEDREKNIALYEEVLAGKSDSYSMDKRFLCK